MEGSEGVSQAHHDGQSGERGWSGKLKGWECGASGGMYLQSWFDPGGGGGMNSCRLQSSCDELTGEAELICLWSIKQDKWGTQIKTSTARLF